MEQREGWLRTMAGIGTLLIWIPVLAPFVLSLVRMVQGARFRFDYLMPAELFPVAMLGAGLLLWTALQTRLRRGLIGGGLAVGVGLLVAGQALAVATGMASGSSEPSGIWWGLVIASIVGYALALIIVGCGGYLLWRDLVKISRSAMKGLSPGDGEG